MPKNESFCCMFRPRPGLLGNTKGEVNVKPEHFLAHKMARHEIGLKVFFFFFFLLVSCISRVASPNWIKSFMWRVLKNVLYVQAWPNYMKGIFDLNKFGIRTIIWLFWIIFSCGGYPRLSTLWIGVLINEWLVAAAFCWLCDSPYHCCFGQILFILDQFMLRYLLYD